MQQPNSAPVTISRADVFRARMRRAAVGAGGLALGAGAFVMATTPTLAQAFPHLLAAASLAIGGTGGPPTGH